jgi:hypothetical protein
MAGAGLVAFGGCTSPSSATSELAAIRAAAIAHAREHGGPSRISEVNIEAVEGDHARAWLLPADELTDPAIIYLRKTDGRWKGLVHGTAFSPDDYRKLGIPPNIQYQ